MHLLFLAAPYWQYRFLQEENKATLKQSSILRYHQIMRQKNRVKPVVVVEEKVVVEDKKYTLIFAPHPDDEILCCTSVIREAVKNGDPLKIIYLTDGDAKSDIDPAASLEYGVVRRSESVRAVQALGVESSDLIWLGFPDSILANLRTESIISPYTFRRETATDTYRPGLSYTRDNLDLALKDVLEAFTPEKVYFPNENTEKHADHITAGRVLWSLIEPEAETIHHYRYAIHQKNFQRDENFYDAQKTEAIRAFKSQFHDESHAQFLLRFAYAPELFE